MSARSKRDRRGRTRLEELRARALSTGVEALDTRELLALALRRSAAGAGEAWASRLLSEFGSLPEVLGASAGRLRQVTPAGVALDVGLIHELHRRALETPLRHRAVLGARQTVADYLRIVLAAEPRRQTRALFLDARQRLIRDEVLGRGSVAHAPLYAREVVRRALELDAAGLILVVHEAMNFSNERKSRQKL
ncbi:MAG: repair protein [Phenylobacterium sp.]|nr:repair protein [Phenylobacterium sp.]